MHVLTYALFKFSERIKWYDFFVCVRKIAISIVFLEEITWVSMLLLPKYMALMNTLYKMQAWKYQDYFHRYIKYLLLLNHLPQI